MKPKLWNGPHALGQGLVRGLELTGSPYLSSHAGDVTAGVMDGKGEVKFGGGEYICCFWRAYETVVPNTRFAYGYYYVYAGFSGETLPEVPDSRPDGYYCSYNGAYLGPIQELAPNGRPYLGDGYTFPFAYSVLTNASPPGYYAAGNYAGPIVYVGSGRLVYHWAFVNTKTLAVKKRRKFGPWGSAPWRFYGSSNSSIVFYKGGPRVYESPGRTTPNEITDRYLSKLQKVSAAFEASYPTGTPPVPPANAFNPSYPLDDAALVAPRDIVGTTTPAYASAGGRLFAVRQGPASRSALLELQLTNTSDPVVVDSVELQSAYSWDCATDGKHIAVAGWGGSSGVIEIYDMSLTLVVKFFCDPSQQATQVGIDGTTVVALDLFGNFVYVWDLGPYLENPPAPQPTTTNHTVLNAGGYDIVGDPQPPGTRLAPERITAMGGKIFVMSTGFGYVTSNPVALSTGEVFLDVYNSKLDHIASVPLLRPSVTEGWGDPLYGHIARAQDARV